MNRTYWLGLAVLIALGACSGSGGEEDVMALNLTTGERKGFPGDAVPDGWVVCIDPMCTEFDTGGLHCRHDRELCERIRDCALPIEVCERVKGCELLTVWSHEPYPTDPWDPWIGYSADGGMPEHPATHVDGDDPVSSQSFALSKLPEDWLEEDDTLPWYGCHPNPVQVCVPTQPNPRPCEAIHNIDRCERRPDCRVDVLCPDWPVEPFPWFEGNVDWTAVIDSLPPEDVWFPEPENCSLVCVDDYDQCPPIPLYLPYCPDGSEPEAEYDDKGCQTGWKPCPPEPDVCDDLEEGFAMILDEARRCDPHSDEPQCDGTAPGGLVCSCPVPVNTYNEDLVDTLYEIIAAYGELGCRDYVCAVDCPYYFAPAHCGDDGFCTY